MEQKDFISVLKDETFKEQAIDEVGKPILRPLSWLQMLFILCILVSPFLLIWYDGTISLKLFATGVLGVLIVAGIYNFIKKQIRKSVEGYVSEFCDKPNERKVMPKTSRFQQKLEQMQRERELKNK